MPENSFHSIRFPLSLALGARGGPQRRTEIITLGSGHERRNSQWHHARRLYDIGTAVKSMSELETVLHFFEERRGMLYGFLFFDPLDHSSASYGEDISPADQIIGTGDGNTVLFQLVKTYGANYAPYKRKITKPILETVRIEIDGQELDNTAFSINQSTGEVTFEAAHIPAPNTLIKAGFEFETPVRFDTDNLTIDFAAFQAGQVPSIPLIEILN